MTIVAQDGRSSNAAFTVVVDAFSAAVAALLPSASQEAIERLGGATGDLLMAVSHQAAVMAAGVVTPLVERQERQADRLEQFARRLNGVRQHSADVQQQADTRIDRLLDEHLARASDHEQRISALEERAVGGTPS